MLSCDEDYSEEDERKRKQNIGNLRTSTPKKSRGAALSDDSPVLSEMIRIMENSQLVLVSPVLQIDHNSPEVLPCLTPR